MIKLILAKITILQMMFLLIIMERHLILLEKKLQIIRWGRKISKILNNWLKLLEMPK